jgi:hypothetical protein
MKDEKTIVIDINLTRGLVVLLALALLGVALLGYLAWGRDEVAASGPRASLDLAQDRPLAQSSGMRQYYLTESGFNNGAEALTACASGYHMASLWEIMDPSNLKYNTDLGRQQTDSGQGPPSDALGWVRTGYESRGSSSYPAGQGNCLAWTIGTYSYWGTQAKLLSDWTAGNEDIHVWEASTWQCNRNAPVWCVED